MVPAHAVSFVAACYTRLFSGLLLAAVLEYILENGASGGTITTFGQALWWGAATVTRVANQLYPVTTGGEIVAFLLMVYAIVVSYQKPGGQVY